MLEARVAGSATDPIRAGGVTVACGERRFGRFQAFVFNMDGVVTDTARLHVAAWKAMFDLYLPQLCEGAGVRCVPFDPVEDYRRYMDGRLRHEAAARFLAERGISIPYGSVGDPPGVATVCGLANDKHERVVAALQLHGVDVYPATADLVTRLRGRSVGLAVVSSSRHADAILEAAGLRDAFDVVIGAVQMERLGLPGKPDPSAFLEAARRLGVSPSHGVVVEDAVVGVEAARAAGFGLVVGLSHSGAATVRAQLAAAADLVVSELNELEVTDPVPCCTEQIG
jgi:alpha,alpha-trehalase